MKGSHFSWLGRGCVGAALALAGVLRATPALADDSARAPGAPPAATAATPPPTVVVHLDSPQPVNLEASYQDGAWRTVCTSPCDAAVQADGVFRISGESLRTSKSFRIEAGGKATLTVDPVSSSGHTLSVVLIVVGSLALLPVAGVTAAIVVGEVAGAILICPLAAAFETVKSQQGAVYGDCLKDIASFFAVGYAQPWVWGPGIAGAAMLTGGIVGLASSGRTTVRASPSPLAAFVPWITPSIGSDVALRTPKPVLYPVVGFRF